MGLLDLISGRKSTFTGTVQRTAHVMTSSSDGSAYFGVLFCEEDEWIRVYTNDLTLAASISFLLPGEVASIEVKKGFTEENITWFRLLSVRAADTDLTDKI